MLVGIKVEKGISTGEDEVAKSQLVEEEEDKQYQTKNGQERFEMMKE
jgi:hypothetical protein